jgi:hypothetical protein
VSLRFTDHVLPAGAVPVRPHVVIHMEVETVNRLASGQNLTCFYSWNTDTLSSIAIRQRALVSTSIQAYEHEGEV